MKIVASNTFEKQFKKAPAYVKDKIAQIYSEIEKAKSWESIPSIKKMQGFENIYRLRIVDYRIGIVIDGQICKLIAIMHRKEIYRYFP